MTPEHSIRVQGDSVALMACLMSLPALSTDIMIPGLGAMAADLNIASLNNAQWIVTAVFVGLVPGQLLFGPLADSVGRRPAMLVGMGIVLLGSLITALAPGFGWLLFGRAVQGFGVAAPRTLTLAIIRDQYTGARMARIVSNVMSVFALVPMIAPVVGQIILWQLSWRWIFGAVFAFALGLLPWFYWRQPETLMPEGRSALSPRKVTEAFKAVAGDRVVFWYAVGTGCVFAGFITYMSTAPQIFQQIYPTGNAFGFWFAFIGSTMVVAARMNGRFVERLGMQRISVAALVIVLAVSLALAAWLLWSAGRLNFFVVVAYLMVIVFVEGALYANMFALAMEPLSKAAGMGATIVHSVSMLVSVPLGMLFGGLLGASLLPLILAFATFACLTLIAMYRAEKGRGSGTLAAASDGVA